MDKARKWGWAHIIALNVAPNLPVAALSAVTFTTGDWRWALVGYLVSLVVRVVLDVVFEYRTVLTFQRIDSLFDEFPSLIRAVQELGLAVNRLEQRRSE